MKARLFFLGSLAVNFASVVAVLSLLSAGPLSLAADLPRPLDLTGQVNSADDLPIANAHVFVYTAGPRVGASPI
ncbi:MAG: hypothetical protein HUU16_11310 [Candidatus Omnitrophica bacterium]|nr:hypothetical protein [Candidatus Omnitrophota bacterium]